MASPQKTGGTLLSTAAPTAKPTPAAWPKQSQCDAFYGNPRGKNGSYSQVWALANLTYIKPPFEMRIAWAPYTRITKIRIHKKCAASLSRVLDDIWQSAGRDQKKIEEWGADKFGGSFNYRLMRGGASLSMHSWGCALDLDPARNGLGNYKPVLTPNHPVALAFKKEGWVHGADWNGDGRMTDQSRPDAMHFQAAIV